jgi:hypothetical protein
LIYCASISYKIIFIKNIMAENGEGYIPKHGKAPEDRSPEDINREQLEQKINEAVVVGQKLVNGVCSIVGLEDKIEVDGSGVEDFLRVRMSGSENPSIHMPMEVGYDIEEEIKNLRLATKKATNEQPIDASIRCLAKNSRFIVSEMKVDGKELNYWKTSKDADEKIKSEAERIVVDGPAMTPEGMKISKKISSVTSIILNDENKGLVSGFLDNYEEFMKTTHEIKQLDDKNGGKIQGRTWAEVYNLTSSANN